jgi:DNA polymerase elongation subunit (family B)
MNQQDDFRYAAKVLENKLERESYPSLHRIPNQDLIYVVDWVTDGDKIYALGPDQKGYTSKFEIEKVGVYGITSNLQVLTVVMNRLGLPVTKTGKFYWGNNFKLIDMMQNYTLKERCECVFIETKTFTQAKKMFDKFKFSTNSKLLTVPHYYDPINLVQCKFQSIDPRRKFINVWLTKNLEEKVLPEPEIPWISFDIETVSTNNMRVPTGEEENDELFSVSIHHSHTSKLYSLIYLPIVNVSTKNLKREMLSLDAYENYEGVENIIEVYNTEKDLLIRTMDLLTLGNKFHFLLGYNSTNYDIKFLVLRCKYFELPMDRFRYSRAFHISYNQIHLDIFKIVMMKYDFSSYTLNNVVRQILKSAKADVDSVALRLTFHYMKSNQKLYSHEIYQQLKIPSVRDIIHYNNIDTILVYRLCKEDGIVQFAIDECSSKSITIQAINKIYNTKQFKIMSQCFTLGLEKGLWFGSITQDDQYIELQVIDDVIPLEIDIRSILQAANVRGKFPGGINFCCKEIFAKMIQEYDYRIAYPLLLQKSNISPETTTITYGSVLLHLFDRIEDRDQYILMDYQSHSSLSKTLTRVLVYKYIYWNKYCGGEIEFTREALKEKQNNLICVIYQGRVGVLSPIIELINNKREADKAKFKQLSAILDSLETERMNLVLNKINPTEKVMEEEDNNNDDFNFGEGSECDGDFNFGEGSECGDEDKGEGEKEIDDDFNFGEGSECGEKEEDFNFGEGSDCDTSNEKLEEESKEIEISYKNGLFIIYKDGSTFLDKISLMKQNNEVMDEIIQEVSASKINYESLYRLQKANSASIYGCLGPLDTIVAATVTCLIRTFLLQSCQYLVQQGCEVLYCDTDSIMIINNTSVKDYSSILNEKFQWTDIECKTKSNVYFVQTKTYYKEQEGELIYSQHKNGPGAWRDFVNFVYAYKFEFLEDIEDMFSKFFKIVYKRIDSDPSYAIQTVKVKATYITETPGKVLKNYIARVYPILSGQHKYKVFNLMDPSSVLKSEYRLDLDLKSASQVNLFKFFIPNFKTAFNLIKRSLRMNNEGIQITISASHIRNIMLRSFLNLYESKFHKSTQMPKDDLLRKELSETVLLEGEDV